MEGISELVDMSYKSLLVLGLIATAIVKLWRFINSVERGSESISELVAGQERTNQTIAKINETINKHIVLTEMRLDEVDKERKAIHVRLERLEDGLTRRNGG